jgi:molybdopterin-guanine dinucleotide biosynthesis protein A
VIGLWPVSALEAIEAILTGEGRHSMRQFAEAISARAVISEAIAANINTPADLAELENRRGL